MKQLALLVLLACSPPPATHDPAEFEPLRHATGAAALLELVPPGADAALEIDLARARADASVTPLLGRVPDLLAHVDVALAAVYRLGKSDARTIFVLRGESFDAAGEAKADGGRTLDEHTAIIGGDPAVAPGKSLATDAPFLRMRDAAMPDAATGAVVRLTARLDKDARVAAAGQLGVDEVPQTISLWGDVADDLAVVALLGEDDDRAAAREAEAVRALAARYAPRILGRELPGRLDVSTAGPVAKLVWHVGPRALAQWVQTLAQAQGGS